MGIDRRHRTGAVASIQGLLRGRAQIQDVVIDEDVCDEPSTVSINIVSHV